MTWTVPPLVTEHEPGSDYQCVPTAGLMQYLAAKPGAAPATLTEAKAIRAASGAPLIGPMNSAQLIAGTTKRYGWASKEVVGFDSLWAQLTPGHSATVSGHPTDAPAGSPPRHWLTAYPGGHREAVFRLDTFDRAWLLDPEAPDGYKGEWVSRQDLRGLRQERLITHDRANGGRH